MACLLKKGSTTPNRTWSKHQPVETKTLMSLLNVPYLFFVQFFLFKDKIEQKIKVNAVELRNSFIREMKLFQFYLVLTPKASFRTNLFNRLGEYLL